MPHQLLTAERALTTGVDMIVPVSVSTEWSGNLVYSIMYCL